MADYYSQKVAGIPGKSTLTKNRSKYHIYVDDEGREYYIEKGKIDLLSKAREISITFIFIVLKKAYNTDPEQYIDDNLDAFQMPENSEVVYLRHKSYEKNTTPNVKRRVIIENVYRYNYRVVGSADLIFMEGLPPNKT